MFERIRYRVGKKNLFIDFIILDRYTKNETFTIYATSYSRVVASGFSENGRFNPEELNLENISQTTTKHQWLAGRLLSEIKGMKLDDCLIFFDFLERHDSWNFYYPDGSEKLKLVNRFGKIVQ